MGENNGVGYSFYSKGWIESYRYFEKNKKNGYGEDYFKKGGFIKKRYYIKNDTMQYKRIFDTLGNALETYSNPWFEKHEPIEIKE